MTNVQSISTQIDAIIIDQPIIDQLLEFQIRPVKNLIFAIKRYGLATDWSDTGVGKTYLSLAICKQLNLRPFIVGPKSVMSTWYKLCLEFEVEPIGVVNYETIKNNKYYADLSSFQNEVREECPYIEVIRSPKLDTITKQPLLNDKGKVIKEITNIIWKLPNNTLLIFDEAHKGKNGVCAPVTSANSQLIVSVKSYLNKANAIYGLFLTGTVTDKMENIDVLMYLFGFYRPYMRKAYTMYLRSLGSDKKEILKKIHGLVFPLRGSRIRKDQVPEGVFKLDDTQAKTYPVSADIAAAIELQHIEIQQALSHLNEKGESQGLGYIIRCWQKIEVLKSSTVAEEAINYLVQGNSVIIFVNFNETKLLITEKILQSGIITIEQLDYIHGDQTGGERDDIVEKFQNEELFLLICNIKAGGVGISLHDIHGVRPRVSLICPTWNVIDLKQALGRIHRANAKSNAIQRIVYCKPNAAPAANAERSYLTIEETICANINEKLETMEILNDNDLHVGTLRI